jgi:hypothetical protein
VPSEGPNSPGTMAQDVFGGIAWTDANNAMASDDSRASCVMGADETSDLLIASDFGFSIPAGATIDGVEVEIEKRASGVAGGDNIALWVEGSQQGDNKASAGEWPASDTYETYGGAADLWALSLTAEQVNASDFGVTLSVLTDSGGGTAEVDHIRITVYYTEAGGGFVPVVDHEMTGGIAE